MVAHHLIEELGIPAESVLEFFCVVARFEYALKHLGWIQDGLAWPKPAWDAFAEQHAQDLDFSRTEQLYDAVEYLLAHPPRRQVVTDGGQLDWEDRTPDEDSTEAEWVISCVKGVRNNLFHGGKYPIDPDDDPERARHLIYSSLEVLREVARVDEISPYFNGWAFQGRE